MKKIRTIHSSGRLIAVAELSREAYQKDLANRDRVSYITLLAHRIQDGIVH